MDAFVTTGKKRKLKEGEPLGDDGPEEEESTEVKLAMLASLVDDGSGSISQAMLLDVLLAHDGSVALAADAFLSRPEEKEKEKKGPKRSKLGRGGGRGGAVGLQTSLRSLFPSSSDQHPQKEEKKGPAATLLSKRGRTLFLYDPVDVEAHTPCTLVHNFLPADVANDLLREMLAEAQTFDTPHTFKMFDQVVSSPHTSCLYLEPAAAAAAQTRLAPRRDAAAARRGQTDSDAFVLNTSTHEGYRYNGSRLSDIRAVTPHMARVRPLVQEAVNTAIQERIRTHYPGARKLKYQNAQPWRPNAAFVNCYNGSDESVGWHSDHLTYLGPRAVIGSLSLGVAREFRVRRIIPRDASRDDPPRRKQPTKEEDDAAGQISIHLPHNSLLVMHAEMQEEWKHCVSPAASIDPHPIGGRIRINITYRDYRAEFHPDRTPRCRCNIAAILRVVQRKKENHGRYFWMCHAGNIPGWERCSFFQWAEFDDDGRPLPRSSEHSSARQHQAKAVSTLANEAHSNKETT